MQRAGDLTLYKNLKLDRQVLHNGTTGEEVILEPSAGGWLLLENAAHGPYVASAEGQQHWCVDLLEFNVVVCDDENGAPSKVVVDSHGGVTNLKTFKSQFYHERSAHSHPWIWPDAANDSVSIRPALGWRACVLELQKLASGSVWQRLPKDPAPMVSELVDVVGEGHLFSAVAQ